MELIVPLSKYLGLVAAFLFVFVIIVGVAYQIWIPPSKRLIKTGKRKVLYVFESLGQYQVGCVGFVWYENKLEEATKLALAATSLENLGLLYSAVVESDVTGVVVYTVYYG